jgi:hypothetical protein
MKTQFIFGTILSLFLFCVCAFSAVWWYRRRNPPNTTIVNPPNTTIVNPTPTLTPTPPHPPLPVPVNLMGEPLWIKIAAADVTRRLSLNVETYWYFAHYQGRLNVANERRFHYAIDGEDNLLEQDLDENSFLTLTRAFDWSPQDFLQYRLPPTPESPDVRWITVEIVDEVERQNDDDEPRYNVRYFNAKNQTYTQIAGVSAYSLRQTTVWDDSDSIMALDAVRQRLFVDILENILDKIQTDTVIIPEERDDLMYIITATIPMDERSYAVLNALDTLQQQQDQELGDITLASLRDTVIPEVLARL